MERRRLSYDETNQRERVIAEIEVGSTRNVYDTLYLHNVGKEYHLDRRTRKCNVTDLTRPFRYRGVLPGSTFQYLFEMGAGGVPYEHALVQMFSGNSSTEHHVSLVTYPSCIPIQIQHFIGPNDYEESKHNLVFTVGFKCLILEKSNPNKASFRRQSWKEVDRSQNYMERRRLSYDETNKRERKIAEIEEGSTRSFYDVLSLHNEGKEYTLDLRTRKCNVTTLTRPFFYRGVLPGSTFQYLSEIGASGVPYESTIVAGFAGNSSTGSEHHVSIVSYPSCVPIQNQHFRGNDYEESNYYNITIGIRDPAVFIPPEECIG
ncbi:hypothetical protein FSP39_015267 [Pinctada imbricata]|uniref:Uncharacterized protein n=1 Tax=Pinctada imbricata TaxID=66713 RepID=A0AA88XX16_PINIB|nr:hypothetical protein FSP39_015267 [Pinctada imbricata]